MTRATRATNEARLFVRQVEAGETPVLKAYKKSPEDPVTAMFGFTGQVVDAETGSLRDMVPWLYDGDGRVTQEGDTFTAEQAEFYFEQDCGEAERRVDFFFPDMPMKQQQRDALFSFCFNLRWSSIQNSSLRRFLLQGPKTEDNPGGWTPEILIYWWPRYRNPGTIFELGLYRRRLAELLVFLLGVSWGIALREAWRAGLQRDRDGGILSITNPDLVIMRARQAHESELAEASRQVIVGDAPETVPSSGVEDAPSEAVKSAAVHAEEVLPPIVGGAHEGDGPGAPPTSPETVGPPPANGGVSSPDIQLTRPEFWSLQVLIMGRLALMVGLIPAIASDMIMDPAFQTAVGGVVAIYIGMFLKWRTRIQREQRDIKREATIDG